MAVIRADRVAYVTNGITGTVSVVDLVQGREVKQIKVGTEPRGCALTPDGSLLYVANHTAGTVSIIDTAGGTVWGTVFVGRNPPLLRSRIRGLVTAPTTRSSSPDLRRTHPRL